MATLIAVYNSEGLVGRCDAKCHDAEHPECDCICGGMNHGVGRQVAAENTRDMAERWVRDFAKKHDLGEYEYEVGVEVVQLPLFVV